MINKHRVVASLLWFIGISATPALADPIDIVNPSFESPALSPGGFTGGVVDGWDANGAAGVINPIPSWFNLPVPDGDQVGYANYDTGQMAQTLSATLQSNTTYTLTVYVGKRLDCCTPNTYSVELYAGDQLLGSESSQDPDPGDFALSTVTFTSADGDPLEGLPLQIVLRSTGAGQSQTAFDNVSLDATPVQRQRQ